MEDQPLNSSPLNEFVEWFLDHLRVERAASEHTVSAYHNDLVKAVNFFAEHGVIEWKDLSPQQILLFEASLGQCTARTTALRRVSSLRSFLKFLKRNSQGPPGDLPGTGGFKKPKRLPKALSPEKLSHLAEGPNVDDPRGLRDRALVELIYGAGLRVSECVELERDGLDLRNATVRVTGKRGKTRVVPLPTETVAWLHRYEVEARPLLAKRPSSRVFLTNRGFGLRRQAAYQIVRRYGAIAGEAGPVGPHTLRHTYAVDLLKGGADLRAVQELLGHESISTTQVYTQMDMDEVRRRYESAHPRS